MGTRTIYQTADYEQQLIGVVRRLPRERVVEVIDFAQFLEFKTSEDYDDDLLGDAANQARIAEENARWDALLETEESQRLLEKMAAEALAEIGVGAVETMKAQRAYHVGAPEQTVVRILHRLPPERARQLVDYARFLEFQTERYQGWLDEEETEIEEEILASERKWDELFTRPESKRLLRTMAAEAREDYFAGRTTDVQITHDGRLAPA